MEDHKKRELLYERHAELFDGRQPQIACGDGWLDLICHLLDCIQNYYDSNKNLNEDLAKPVVVDIKEKFGRLSISIDGGDETIEGMIWFAQHLSTQVCEITGRPGRLRSVGNWYKTLCDDKAFELGYD